MKNTKMILASLAMMLLFTFCFSASETSAQTCNITNTSISGNVKRAVRSGGFEPVAGIAITANDGNNGFYAITDAGGDYTITGLNICTVYYVAFNESLTTNPEYKYNYNLNAGTSEPYYVVNTENVPTGINFTMRKVSID